MHNGAGRKAGLNKCIQDAGWDHFLSILACTPACAGKRVEAVTLSYTSQDCSGCGAPIWKSLIVRTHVCANCGLILDRDLNPAIIHDGLVIVAPDDAASIYAFDAGSGRTGPEFFSSVVPSSATAVPTAWFAGVVTVADVERIYDERVAAQ